MKNFLDLLATEYSLSVVVNGHAYTAGLLDILTFNETDTVEIDGLAVLPHYRHLCKDSKLCLGEPFYRWYHRVSGQGWLLTPNKM